MTEDRKYAILFAATLLCARKLMEMGDRPSPAKFALVEDAISNAAFTFSRRIDGNTRREREAF